VYDGQRVSRLAKEGSFMFLHKVGGQVYTQQIMGGLHRLENNELRLIPGSEFLADEEVKSMIALDNGDLLIGTTRGLYTYNGQNFSPWNVENAREVIAGNINTMTRTEDKIIIGTILSGLYIYDFNFSLLQRISTDNRLQNNTVLSLYSDAYNNVWAGLDKGLSYIAFNTPIHSYADQFNPIGSVYAAALYKNELYIGTNQGIFWYQRDENGNFYKQELIQGSQGQVWFLKEEYGKLYAGLNEGTFLIEGKRLKKISDVFGGYNLKEYPTSNERLLLQSTYSELVVYSHQNDELAQLNTLAGFSAPARYLEVDHLGNIWAGHSVKGVFKLQPNIQFDKIEHILEISPEQGLPASTNRVFKLDNRIMSSNRETLYEWDTIGEKFVPYTGLDSYFTEEGTITNVIPAGYQKYWVLKNRELNLFEIHFNTVRLLHRVLPEMYGFNLVENYENVIPLSENLHIICLDEGFALLNLDLAKPTTYPKPVVDLQEINVHDNKERQVKQFEVFDEPMLLANKHNTLTFTWNTNQVTGHQSFFQYRLHEIDENWSKWTSQTSHTYERLPAGEYHFQIRTVGIDGIISTSPKYLFTIKKPWYLSAVAYVLYIMFISSFLVAIRLFISRRRWKQHTQHLEQRHKEMQLEREKAEKEIISLKNEKLEAEIEHKSTQLATNTMAIMRKNNLLSSINDELEKQKAELGTKLPSRYYQKIKRLIEGGIEDEHEWELFEQLYDQTHSDFFKRLKAEYPNLTPSDLRLCAYLRMNLSSKEIAPLLNISVRGVEERRYRLRKRLNISTNTNLNELIMTF
jgi:DNA-binding CsgD family transcriptional regulator